MKMNLTKSNRYCIAEKKKRFIVEDAKKELLTGRNAQGNFSVISTVLPPTDETAFKIYEVNGAVIIAVAFSDTLKSYDDDIEIFFDPYHDHIGFFQFVFHPDREPFIVHHLPYAEHHSTSFRYVSVKKHFWLKEKTKHYPNNDFYYLFAWFSKKELFRNGHTCGLNVCRSCHTLNESSSWNPGGNYFQDATSFGHLYSSKKCADFNAESVEIKGTKAVITHSGNPRVKKLKIANPHGKEFVVPAKKETTVNFGKTIQGRYRIYPMAEGKSVEPVYYSFDVCHPKKRNNFTIDLTYDLPDNIIPNYYTPARLKKEISMFAENGIQGLYWIDYGGYSDFWSFDLWGGDNSKRTFATCGDVLPLAVKYAKQSNMKFYGVFKPFDMGFNVSLYDKKTKPDMVREAENKYAVVLKDVAKNPGLTMQANPHWRRDVALPVTNLRIYSSEPVEKLKRSDVKIWTSENNSGYRIYNKPFKISTGESVLPHCSWSPAGNVSENGKRKNWFIEISGLKAPAFLALEIKKEKFRFVNRNFVFASAVDSRGNIVAPAITLDGDLKKGFRFCKDWPGWANYTEKILSEFVWEKNALGVMFRKQSNMPVVLEPSFEATRRIWLKWVKRILDSGADGVDIRTLCHHNASAEWLSYAFAQPVRDEFRKLYGRDVRPEQEDYEKVRIIRGKFYTEFLREAKKLTTSYKKKLILHLEPGIEVGPEHDTRMQIFWDWRTWIEEDIPDAIVLKFWKPQSMFIHEQVLPLAKRKNIPVHILETNFFLSSVRSGEFVQSAVSQSRNAGFSSYIFYESAVYVYLNPEGVPTQIRHIGDTIKRARDAVSNYSSP